MEQEQEQEKEQELDDKNFDGTIIRNRARTKRAS